MGLSAVTCVRRYSFQSHKKVLCENFCTEENKGLSIVKANVSPLLCLQSTAQKARNEVVLEVSFPFRLKKFN